MTSISLLSMAVVAMVTVPMVTGCSFHPDNPWRPWSMELIVYTQEIVLRGKAVERVEVTDPDTGSLLRKDDRFEVSCVLKNPDGSPDIPSEIIIHMVEPVNSCSGTQYELNETIILGVTRLDAGSLVYDEPNPTPDGAAFPATPENLLKVGEVCGMNVLMPPDGVTDTGDNCPPGPPQDAGCVIPTTTTTTAATTKCPPNFEGCGAGGSHKAVISLVFLLLAVTMFLK